MSCLLAGLAIVSAVALTADDGASQEDQAAQKQRLAKMQQLVGAWRGVGQPQHGSTKDSWLEEAEWVWSFGKDGPVLVASLKSGKYFSLLKLLADKEQGQYSLMATPASGGDEIRYSGKLNNQEQLVLAADQPRDDLPQRLSFRFVAGGDRLLVLVERKGAGDQFARLAEIGYTRQGSGFGKGVTQRECVVTGGLGTIAVTHNGKSYYVCCTGCRDYFNEKPEEVLAEYFARKEAEKAKK